MEELFLDNFKYLLNKKTHVKITPEICFDGILTDIGDDIVVVFDGQRYVYIPLVHVHKIRLSRSDEEIGEPTGFLLSKQTESISYHTILTNAKMLFIEIHVLGNQSLHGYITDVLNDYFVFYSPIYKTMYISLDHLKWLTPCNQNITPYTLNKELLPVRPSITIASPSWEEQLKKLENNFVVFDMGEESDKIGLLKKIENNLIELITANGETVHLNLTHIKSVHAP